MKRIYKKIVNYISKHPNILSLLFISTFFLTLVILFHSKLLFTPDYGESDSYHLNLSFKYLLSQSLKSFSFPFWTDNIQNGFPIFAEGQIGALFLPNIIFFGLFPFVLGYNLILFFSLFSLALGFYLFLREFKIKPLLALLFSLIFTFNGSISLHWVHLAFVQTFSLSPWLFLLILKYYKTGQKKYAFLYTLFVFQLIVAGHIQAAYIILFGISLWIGIYFFCEYKTNKIKTVNYLKFIFLTASGIILSFPQLLPTYELSKFSSRGIQIGYDIAVSLPMSIKELVAYIYPYTFGTPQNGTYNTFAMDGGFYWENTPYLSIIFFALLITAIYITRKFIIKQKLIIFTILLCVFFTAIALGKNSPLYVLFNFSPFNYFRVPSKYLIIANFFLIFVCAFLVNKWYVQAKPLIKKLIVFLLIINSILLIQFTFSYHLFLQSNKVLAKPLFSTLIDNNYLISIGQETEWNKIFMHNGWQRPEDYNQYLFYKNFIYPNSNLLFDKKNVAINTGGLKLKRNNYLNDFFRSSFVATSSAYLDKSSENLMNILNIKYLITSNSIKSENNDIHLIKSINNKISTISLYENSLYNSTFYYIPKDITLIHYLDDFQTLSNENKISLDHSVVENFPQEEYKNDGKSKVQTVDKQTIKGLFEKKTFVVFKHNIYPDWKVYIDNKKTTIYTTNLIHMGILVPKGEHVIKLQYENDWFLYGSIISFLYFMLYVVVLRVLKFI